jgi:hypothetical protein
VKTITEAEFARICRQIIADRDIIIRNNPVGNEEEILLWMLLGTLISYLSISEAETPCFNGKPDAGTYRNAIRFVLKGRMAGSFEPEKHLELLS